ncbi:MAG: hypothetical protein F6K09_33180, partial [Merismopedia sp. SIO2A8]|nr:hypothetical protein [Merismopedia sp. SIO2A8]
VVERICPPELRVRVSTLRLMLPPVFWLRVPELRNPLSERVTAQGVNGALLQMLSHGLIAAALFFLSGVTYERTHTLVMEKMGGMAQEMPKVFALFTAASMASLALPGMSGFVGELSIFLGVSNSDVYSSSFKVVVVMLAAVGLIVTPIYLLSMLRKVFYGEYKSGLIIEKYLGDAKPREIFVALCLLVPIIGIGLYPKLVMQSYDVKTVAVTAQVREALPVIAQERSNLYSGTLRAPQLPNAKPQALLGVVD